MALLGPQAIAYGMDVINAATLRKQLDEAGITNINEVMNYVLITHGIE